MGTDDEASRSDHDDAPPGKQKWWVCKECPLSGDCCKENEKAWKRAACWGLTLREAKHKLFLHLQNSSYHKLDEDDARAGLAAFLCVESVTDILTLDGFSSFRALTTVVTLFVAV